MKFTAKEVHDKVIDALDHCPQFRPIEFKYCRPFGQNYKTLEDVVRYWQNDDLLWRKGYHEYLDPNVALLFREVRVAQADARANVCHEYERAAR